MIPYFRSLLLSACLVALLAGWACAEGNPRVVKAGDPTLKKEFEYLVFDLGKGVELNLVKVRAKGKTFTIGSSKKEQDAVVKKYYDGKRPAALDFEAEQEVTLTDDYYIGRFEVTRGQFRRFVEDANYKTDAEMSEGGYGWNEAKKTFEGRDRKYSWKNTGVSTQNDDYPVTNVTRNDARKFCEWLAKKAGGKLKPREVRLPGEAEWEFAARAGSRCRFAFGDDEEKLAEYANVADATAKEMFPKWNTIKATDGHVFAAPVGRFKPNNFGLYDMHGNVWEWCQDFYAPKGYTEESQKDPTGPSSGAARVQRGGGWSSAAQRCRSAARAGRDPSSYRGCYLGFRVVLVRTPDGSTAGDENPRK